MGGPEKGAPEILLGRLREALAGRYEILGEAGRGGMASVYRARDLRHERNVALKVLDPELAAAVGPERFLREIRIAAGLQHPNILPLYDSGEADSLLYYVMPFVEGATLSAKLARAAPLSVEETLTITREVAGALDYAHAKGLVHRDVKPGNILFQDGRAVLADFGLATAVRGAEDERLTQEGMVLGTPAYMSPEQASGKEADGKSDLYSLACVVYEMLAGDPPFTGRSVQAVLARHVSDVVPPIRSVRPQLPRGMDQTMTRALAKVPADRYGSAADLVEALRAPTVPAAGRRWGIAAVLGVLAVAAALWILRPDDGTSLPAASYMPRPLTFTRFWETNPTWSPGGDSIAFARMSAGSVGIFVQPVAGGAEAVEHVDGPGDEVAPRWSPDGKHLAYVSSSQPGTPVCIVRLAGGTPRTLIDTNIRTLDVDLMMACLGDRPWQDGETLLVSRATDAGQLAIFRVHLDGRDTVQLTFPPVGGHDFGGSLSFDGEHIVFARRIHGRGTLWTMPADGGEPEELLVDQWDNLAPAWRKDGKHVAFLSAREGAYANVWELDVAGGAPRRLTSETRIVYSFSVSADDRIAYAPMWHNQFLRVVDVETGETRLLAAHTGDNNAARFSPDGTAVAYHSTRTGNCEIWIHRRDGSGEYSVADDPGWDFFPDWSPSGELIFVSNREEGDVFKIFLLDGGGKLRKLVDQPISLHLPYPDNASLRWSPDGQWIAYLVSDEEGTALWTVGRDGKSPRRRLTGVEGFDWYLDQRRAVITRLRDGVQQLVAVDLETLDEEHLWSGPHIELDVAPDGSAVAFCHGRGHMGMGLSILKLRRPAEPGGLPTADGEPVALVPAIGTWHVHQPSWSADSKSLVYTEDEDFGDVIELVPNE